MNIRELAEQRGVRGLSGEAVRLASPKLARISPYAVFDGRDLRIGKGIRLVGAYTTIGASCRLGDRVLLEEGVRLEDHVQLDSDVEIGGKVLIQTGAWIGRMAILRAGVIVGPHVLIPAGAQVGYLHVIPSTKCLMALGPLGTSRRMMTIHGSDDGPRYSAGCQYSDDWEQMEYRIRHATGTTEESAAHYRSYLDAGVLQRIGEVVQRYYEAQAEQVKALRDQAVALGQLVMPQPR